MHLFRNNTFTNLSFPRRWESTQNVQMDTRLHGYDSLIDWFGFKAGLLVCITLLFVACSGGVDSSSLGEDVIFHDEFVVGQTGDWLIEGDADGQTSIINEQLMIDLNAPNIAQFSTLADQSFTDVIYEVDARQLAGDLGNTYGVLFRVQDPTMFYRFELTGDGLYMVERHNSDGSWTRFVDDWTSSPAISQGINTRNHIRIEAIGNTFAAYVNDQLVHQFVDDTFSSGTIGVDAGTFVQPHTQAVFDNVVVRMPTQAP